MIFRRAFALIVLLVSLLAASPAFAAEPAGDGTVLAFGTAQFHGSPDTPHPVVAMAASPTGQGYWIAAADGGVFAYGDAGFFGSAGALPLNRPIVGMAAAPDGSGYWLVASDGGVFSYGSARFLGSTGGVRLNRPIVGMAATPSGQGYWLVASDGGVFTFGDAGFFGSAGDLALNRPIVGMARARDGSGYWLVASDGGVFAYGSARFAGSPAGAPLQGSITSMAATPTGLGYWLAAADGGVFAYGDALFQGSGAGRIPVGKAVVAIAATPDGAGYFLASGVVVLAPGSLGQSVTAVQQRLLDLGYWVQVTGAFDAVTRQAVYALEKAAGLPRVGVVAGPERAALEQGLRPAPRLLADGMEIDKSRQLILVIRGGAVQWVFNTSTGNDRPYTSFGVRAVAHTPEGHFGIYTVYNGLRVAPLGLLWRPRFFTGGYAIHGSASIPPFPASHGCARVSNAAIDFIWANDLMPLGIPVFVY